MTAASAVSRETEFHEFDIVRLRSMAYTDRATLPIGAVGTIVFRHGGADDFEVEFAEPVPTVIALRSADLVHA